MYPWSNCIIQAKADGLRCLLVIYKNTVYLVFESEIRPIGVSNMNNLSVFECELMKCPNESQYLLVYDLHMWEDDPIANQKYFYRIRTLQA